MLWRPSCLQANRTQHAARTSETQTPSPAVQFPWLPALTLLGVPAVVIFLWVLKHVLFGGISIGWAAVSELALPLGACIFAALVFLVPNPMHALLSLLGVFFTSVLFYLAAGIAFVGVVFLIVYVGAVAVLFLFVIMLLNVKSLASKEALVQHLTQWLAIFAAALLFWQLYASVFTALSLALMGWNTRVSALELTNAEAVLFYIRFEAADINRLAELYTVHSPALLVTTLFLLVSLLGAIILATVTTERATALADIRAYTVPVVAGVSVLVIFYLFPDLLDLLQDMLPFLFNENFILFMSMFTPFSHRSRAVFRPISENGDGRHRVTRSDRVRVILPKITASHTSGRLILWKRYRLAGSTKKGLEEIMKYWETVGPAEKGPLLRRARREVMRLAIRRSWWLRKRPVLVKNKQKGFLPFHPPHTTRRSSAKYISVCAKVLSATRPVTEKWNARTLLSYFARPMRRERWLWRWRPERATSLLRAKKVFDPELDRKEFIKDDWEIWEWQSHLSTVPLSPFNLGLIGYIRYLYSTRLFPFLFYWAWRGRAFLGNFLVMFFFLPLVLVPFPWFLDDYDVVWTELQALHHRIFNSVLPYVPFIDERTPWVIKEVVTVLLLYPTAAFKVAYSNPWGVIWLAALYAYERVQMCGADFARDELQDSTCNFFRIRADKYLAHEARVIAAAELAVRRRHPDKGRTDLPLLLTAVTGGSQVPAASPSTTAPVCPVSSAKLWELLTAFADYIRITPRWAVGWESIYLQYWAWPVYTLAFALFWAGIFYNLFSFFIILNWSRIYKGRSRPSLLFPVILLLLTLYAGLCCYPYMNTVKVFSDIIVSCSSLLDAMRIMVFFLGLFALPYFMSRYQWTKHYKQFSYGNPLWLRKFVNYYYTNLPTRTSAETDAAQAAALMDTSIDELREQIAVERVARKKAQFDHVDSWVGRDIPLRRTIDKSYFDPEPNPVCRPRRSASHRYLTSPFTGRKRAFVPYTQARRPMPPKVTFTGMFYPTLILFVNLPLPNFANFAGPLFTSMVHLIPSCLIQLSLNLTLEFDFSTIPHYLFEWALFLVNGLTHSPLRYLPPLHFETPHVLISFLPEVTLAVMIMYLIAVVAIELADNRAPKVLAIECWRAACCGLAFVAFLYCLQLFGSIESSPVASGYLYISKGLTASKLFVALTSLFVLYLSENYIREHTRHVLEFSIILLLAVLLLLILVSANNLMLVFFSLAGFSLNLYILILYDGADAASREASLKYFYLSTLSAGFILFGILLIYVTIGDVTYFAIRFYMSTPLDENTAAVMSSAVLFILIGFFFKLSAFPGHLWAVEVYEGSPLPVMAFFVLPTKVAVFVTFMRLLNTGLLDFSHIWLPAVTVAALGSLLWGALAATQERKITRFLGYASINQMGFLLLGLIADTDDALRSAFFYLVLYAIMTGGFLLVFTQLRKETGATFVTLSAFRGLGKTENLVCWNLAVFLFSMAGIPPLAGFFGKYYLLSSLMEKGLFAPVIIGLAVSLITAYYYLRIIKTFWFEEDIAIKPSILLLSGEQRMLLSVLEAALWVAAVFAPWLLPILTDTIATLAVCADGSFSCGNCTVLNLFINESLTAHTCDPAAANAK